MIANKEHEQHGRGSQIRQRNRFAIRIRQFKIRRRRSERQHGESSQRHKIFPKLYSPPAQMSKTQPPRTKLEGLLQRDFHWDENDFEGDGGNGGFDGVALVGSRGFGFLVAFGLEAED